MKFLATNTHLIYSLREPNTLDIAKTLREPRRTKIWKRLCALEGLNVYTDT